MTYLEQKSTECFFPPEERINGSFISIYKSESENHDIKDAEKY